MITSINLKHFRGHGGKFEFGPGKNLIRGRNEAGKSSLKEAISFAWMGTDSSGTRAPDHLISVSEPTMEVSLSTPKSTIRRLKSRGKTGKIYLCRPALPDTEITQTDLLRGIALTPEVFMSSWLVGYFMSLGSEEKLQVLGEVAKLDRRLLLQELLPLGVEIPSHLKLQKPQLDAQAIAGTRRQEQNKLQAAKGALAALKAQLEQIGVVQVDEDSYTASLASVEASLQEFTAYFAALTRFQTETARWSAIKDSVESAQRAASQTKAEIAKLERLDLLEQEGRKVEALHSQAVERLKECLQAERMSVTLPAPVKPSADTGECPTCLQSVSKDHADKLRQDYMRKLEEYNIHERNVANHNQKIEAAYEIAREQEQSLSERLKVLRHRYATAKAQHEILSTTLRRQEELATADVGAQPTPPSHPGGDPSALQKERDRLSAELYMSRMQRTNRDKLVAEINRHEVEIRRHEAEIERLHLIEKALLELPARETEATLAKVSIPGVRMSLQDGELVLCDDQGVDYRCLSDGRKMKIDILLAMAIKKAAGPSAPPWIFVDNADLIDDNTVFPQDTQVLIAHVDPTSADVVVIQM